MIDLKLNESEATEVLIALDRAAIDLLDLDQTAAYENVAALRDRIRGQITERRRLICEMLSGSPSTTE